MRPRLQMRATGLGALTLLLLLPVLLAAGCDVPSTGGLGQVFGSGTPATRTYDLTGFTGVRVDNGFAAEVTHGDSFAVSITVDDNLVEHLRVEADGDTLRIGMDPLYSYRDATLKATVTMPTLTALETSGAATAGVSGFASGDPLDLQLSGASAVTLTGARAGQVALGVSGASSITGELEAQEIGGEASGAARVVLEGSASALRLEASGGSRLELKDLTASGADLQLSGGSLASVRVAGTLNVDASGASKLDYYGSPTLGTVDVSGGARVDHAGD